MIQKEDYNDLGHVWLRSFRSRVFDSMSILKSMTSQIPINRYYTINNTNDVLHAIKDDLYFGFSVVGPQTITNLICLAIDTEDKRKKKALIELLGNKVFPDFLNSTDSIYSETYKRYKQEIEESFEDFYDNFKLDLKRCSDILGGFQNAN